MQERKGGIARLRGTFRARVRLIMPSPQPVFDSFIDGALASYNFAIEKDPQDDEAWHARGEHYESLLELDRAISDYSRALAINPDRLDARLDRAFCYASLRQHDAAIADYDWALKLDPRRAHSWFLRGAVHECAGSITKAIADFQRVTAIDPTHALAQVRLGYGYIERGEYAIALPALDA